MITASSMVIFQRVTCRMLLNLAIKNLLLLSVGYLKEYLALQLESILENNIFKAISVILDSKCYQFLESDIVYNEVKVVYYFESPMLANNCNLNFLKEELKTLHNHIKRYVSKCLSEKCWPIIFCIGLELGIGNLLHVTEICLTAPLSNA